jgi:hypothetical protein
MGTPENHKKPKSSSQPPSADGARALGGYISWTDGAHPGKPWEVKQAILRNNDELAIDCDTAPVGEPPFIFTIVMKRVDELAFSGHWSFVDGADSDNGPCTCRLYSNGRRFALIGGWQQDGVSAKWFGELYPI